MLCGRGNNLGTGIGAGLMAGWTGRGAGRRVIDGAASDDFGGLSRGFSFKRSFRTGGGLRCPCERGNSRINMDSRTPNRATERMPGLPSSVDAFFARAMAKHPQHRFDDAREMAEAFVRSLAA